MRRSHRVILRERTQRLVHRSLKRRIRFRDFGMILDVVKQGISQCEILGVQLVETIGEESILETGPFVPDVVGFYDGTGTDFILDPEIPVLHIRHSQTGSFQHIDACPIQLSRIEVRQGAKIERWVPIIPIVNRGSLERSRVSGKRMSGVEAEAVPVAKAVLERWAVIDPVSSSNHEPFAWIPGKAEARCKLLIVLILEAFPIWETIRAARLAQEDESARVSIRSGIRIGRIET